MNHTTDPFAPVSYLHLDELELVNKDVPEGLSQQQRLDYYGIKVEFIIFLLKQVFCKKKSNSKI